MSTPAVGRSWPWLVSAHARWVIRMTWRNGEQLLLLIAIPVAAYFALTRTDVLSSSNPPLVVTTVMVVLASGFTSPAISLAFDRRYGSFALIGTTPLPRSAIIAGTVVAIGLGTLVALGVLIGVGTLISPAGVTNVAFVLLAAVLGLVAVTPWAFVLGGMARSESVLVIANGIFVLATLFGGVLIPADALPYGAVASWFPPGAMVQFASSASWGTAAVLAAWGLVGAAVATRTFRWR